MLLGPDESWRIVHGDCLDKMHDLPDGCIMHVITDPPYEAEAHTNQRRVKASKGITKLEPLDFAPITEDTRAMVSTHFARLATRWVIAFCQIEAVAAWRDVFEGVGLSWRRACVWVKPDGMPQLTGDRPGMGYESIACAHKPGRSRWNGGGRSGVFLANKGRAARTGTDWGGETGHPTIKPLDLMLELVELFTDPGDVILDPFCGSGTTGVAAVRLGRRFIGIEREERYHKLATERLSAEAAGTTLDAYRAGQRTLFGGSP